MSIAIQTPNVLRRFNTGRSLGASLLLTSILAPAVLMVGCASTATGAKQSAMVGLSSASEPLRAEAPAGTVMAVIRYPAVVEPDARDAFYKAFGDTPIGGNGKSGDSAERANIADSVIVKSNYFALSLYKEMAARLPEHGVLLSPHTIKLGTDGTLTSAPLTQSENLPSVVTVDFATYSYPDSKKMMSGEPLTFGDLVTPLVTVRSDHRAAPATQGVLLASRPLMPYAAGGGQSAAKDSMTAMQSGQFDRSAPELDFVSYLTRKNRFNVSSQSLGGDTDKNAVQSYPVEKIKLDGVALSQLGTANDGSVDPLERVFSDAMADLVVRILNDVDIDQAVMAKRAAAIADFDPSLAALTYVGSSDTDYMARLRYAERLLDAERKYLSVQSLRIFDGIHNGEMGAQMRDMIVAEAKVLDERRRLARKQNTATALAVLGAVAAGASIANGGGGSNCGNARTRNEYDNCRRRERRSDYGNQILTNMMIQGAVFAGTEAYRINQTSKTIGANYLSSIVPALEQQTTITVDLLDSNETITAIRYEDLKDKLQTLYASKQRSLDTVATRCAFNGPNGETGTWMGVCDGGKAAGAGAGIVKNVDGTAAEYYGNASGGMANGAGLMIMHGPDGSYAIEGEFAGGRANGPARVSKPGQGDRLRTFRGGEDIGSASTAPVSPFDLGAAR